MALVAQMVERKTLNLVVVGSSPTVGTFSYSLVGQDNRFSPCRPGFESRYEKQIIILNQYRKKMIFNNKMLY